mgnify:CR=1 FL=1
MGIKDINATVKEISPDAFTKRPLSYFAGTAIAIDANLWMYKAKSSAMKAQLSAIPTVTDPTPLEPIIAIIISNMYGFISQFVKHNITPVWIFDGPVGHPEKIKAARLRRKVEREVKKTNIEDERKRILALSPLERTTAVLFNFRKMLLTDISVGQEEIDSVKHELTSLGVPNFDAPWDAEIFASVLSVERKVVGVWTIDTDTYAAGARLVFTGFSTERSAEGLCVDIVIPAIIHEDMGMTFEQFRDFCIILQCDFNVRIPMFGPKTALKLYRKYNCDLDLMMESEPGYDWSLLNVENCRELLAGPIETEITIENLRIDRRRWAERLEGRDFFMEPPETDPEMIEIEE